MTPERPDHPWVHNRVMGRPRVAVGNKTCCRCGRAMRHAAARMPDGQLCMLCLEEAAATYGTCPGCHTHRLLPGRDPDTGAPSCRDCAGVIRNFECGTCGNEGLIYRGGDCRRCALRRQLTDLLQPQRHPQAQVLIDALGAVPRPASIMTWLLNPHAAALLRGLGDGSIAYTHDAFDAQRPGKTTEHVRALLVGQQLLPARDPYEHRFHRWTAQTLDAIPDATNRNLIRQYVAWKHNPRIRGLAQEGKATSAAIANARQSVTVATQFLAWMTSNGLELKHATQLDIDSWLAPGPSTRHRARDFVQWAVAARHATNITVPAPPRRDAGTIDHDERLAWIRRCLTDTRIPTYLRVVILLTLLYGQPLVRIVALPRTAIEQDDDEVYLRFTRSRAPVPPPFAALLLHQRDHHSPTGSSPDVDSPWLFPGRRAGQHLTAGGVHREMRRSGLRLFQTRNAALRVLVKEAPAPVIAKALGFTDNTLHRHAAIVAQEWQQYAATIIGTSDTDTALPDE